MTSASRCSWPRIEVARSLHFLILCWLLLFIVVHTTPVFTTSLLRQPHRGEGTVGPSR